MAYFSSMEWFEELPISCPPENAHPPDTGKFYRLVEQYPPTERDFFSYRKLFPNKSFNTSECRARSLSIFNEFLECVNLLKLPAHKSKKVVQLKLTSESGAILQTGRVISHFSWWRSKTYNPVPNCEEADLTLIL